MPSAEKKPKTLYDKVFQDHVVNEQEDGTILLYIGIVPLIWWLLVLALMLLQIDISYTK